MEQHFTAWLTVDPTMVLNTNCDVLILEDEQTGPDWTTKPGAREEFSAETSTPAETRGDHSAAQADAEDLMKQAGWETVGDWEQVDSGYVVTVQRADES
jgi:hypothetical protein